jgi:hypothetical protein
MSTSALRKQFSAALYYAAALALGVFMFFAAESPASAQSVYGTIVGTVSDATGSAIPAASVTLTNLGTNEARSAKTDGNGSYTFVNLLPGSYGIAVEKDGFKKLLRSPIEVQVQSEIRVDTPLQIGDSAQTVEVLGAP